MKNNRGSSEILHFRWLLGVVFLLIGDLAGHVSGATTIEYIAYILGGLQILLVILVWINASLDKTQRNLDEELRKHRELKQWRDNH